MSQHRMTARCPSTIVRKFFLSPNIPTAANKMTHAFTVRPEKELLRLVRLRRFTDFPLLPHTPPSLRRLAQSARHYGRLSLQAVLANNAPENRRF